MTTFFFILILAVTSLATSEDNISKTTKTILYRLEALHRVAKSDRIANQCNRDNFIIITEIPFGNSGNHLIEFTNGIWVADKINATLVVPIWMQDVLIPFNTTTLSSYYCFTQDQTVPEKATKYEVTSEESFFLYMLQKSDVFSKHLPDLNDEKTGIDISIHFLKVYAALWSSPISDISKAAVWLIDNYLNSEFEYTTVHKRQLEGGCNKLVSRITSPSDFSPLEIAMDRPEWKGNLARFHPLCHMPIDFVLETQNLTKHSNSKLFMAYDGYGEIESYKQHNAVFSHVLTDVYAAKSENSHLKTVVHKNMKFIDMFIGMHGKFFILNPASTFSWQIYLIRVIFGLESVPIIKKKDVYLQQEADLLKHNRTSYLRWDRMQSIYDLYLKPKQ